MKILLNFSPHAKTTTMRIKAKIVAAIVTIAVSSIFIIHFSSSAGANATGAPLGNTGSPGDGTNCISCHTGGSASNQAGLITSTVPLTGYVPGQTYTVTGTVTTSGKTKFGFQISPQNVSGALKGTMTVTNSATSQLINSGKYITHKFAGTSFPSGTATWSFDWTAPAGGSGDVTFYGAFNSTNSNSNSTGDIITLSSLTVSEDASTGILDMSHNPDAVSVYPNPFTDKIYLKNASDETAAMDVSILDVSGKVIKHAGSLRSNEPVDLQELAAGYYMVRVETAEGAFIKRVTKK